MVAITDRTAVKARLLDLTTGMLEMCRDGTRDIEAVCAVLQIVKDREDFAEQLLQEREEESLAEEPEIPAPTVTSFPLTVNYDLSVEQLVMAGKYDYPNPDITAKNFPVIGTGTSESEAFLVHLNRDISTEEAEKELDRLGFRPGNLHELLAFGVRYPEEQRKFPIVELASRWRHPRGHVRCAYLGRFADDRKLDLGWVGRDWHDDCRFLAFRK